MTIIEEKLRSGPVEFNVYECGKCGVVLLNPQGNWSTPRCSCDETIPVADTLTLKLND